MKKRISFIIIFLTVIVTFGLFVTNVYAEEQETIPDVKENLAQDLNLEDYISTIDEYVKKSGLEDVDISSITKELMSSSTIDYNSLIGKVLGAFSKEVMGAINGSIAIFIIVIVMALIRSLELENKSDVTKIANLVCFLVIATITIATFIDVISMLKDVINVLTTLMQTISPFMMAVLIATGAITSTGIIQPLLLFIASAIGFIITYIVIPFLSISVAFNVISTISENLRLDKLSKLFSNSSLWVVSVVLTIFLGILSLETSLSTSVDSLAVKTTQTAVSNFVPVVGKFFSDSFETVVGATQIISKVGGGIAILSIVLIALIPILKILSIMIIYMLLGALVEPICGEENINKYISGFANIYKVILGILIGVAILFVISSGIVFNLASSVVK
ncbi:MAG: stage III sporulation protein AE [Clostridia bacterium]|nr:stage III sporulation protein AE [Clostridia bacterium]